MKRYTPNSATPNGSNTMFLQIAKHYTHFSALHQVFPTLLIICAQVAAKHYIQNTRWCPFKIKKTMSSAGTLKHYPPVNTTFVPPYFSLDNTCA
jgi:hypothetical protein